MVALLNIRIHFIYIFIPRLSPIQSESTQCSTFRKKSWGQLASKFSFFVTRTSILVAKNYITGFSFVKDNGLSLVYVFPKKKVTYLGGHAGDQAWKFDRH